MTPVCIPVSCWIAHAGCETSDLEAVLDGELDEMMAAHLRMRGAHATNKSLSQQPGDSSDNLAGV